MRIITYDELKDPYQFLKLMEPAFGWAADPRRVAWTRRIDERYRSPYGFGLIKRGELVGFVGVMDIPVKTRGGQTEKAGGVFCVATDPGLCRAGIATTLLDRAHSHFRTLGYRFAFLCTSHALVAHSLYDRLGYHDIKSLDQAPRAYKLHPGSEPRPGRPQPSRRKPDLAQVEQIYTKAMKSRTGFAIRIPNWARIRTSERRIRPATIFVAQRGYAIAETWADSLFASEVLALDLETYLELLDRMSATRKRVLAISHVLDPRLARACRERNFRLASGRHSMVMCKPLADVPFEKAFDRSFYFTPLDSF